MKRIFLLLITFWMVAYVAVAQTYRLGDVITNSNDGSKGVVFWIHPDGSGGWMVALNDISTGCTWGTETDISALSNISGNMDVLADTAGYNNTKKIRTFQNNNAAYAAGKVAFANGWYLPAAGQMLELYGALPFIQNVILANGGSNLSENVYWTSSEYSASYAWGVDYGTNDNSGYSTYKSKTATTGYVRAVRSFSSQNIVYDSTLTYQWSNGVTTPYINVSPTQTTEYSVVVSSAAGCTAETTKTVVVGGGATQHIYTTICAGETYQQNGFNASTAGVYTRTISDNGCTATIQLHLTVLPPIIHHITASICTGETYSVNGFDAYETGTYSQRWFGSNGCDSIVELNLTVLPDYDTMLVAAICDNETYQENGFNVSSAGVYEQNLTAENGCDSTTTLYLTVNPTFHKTESQTICNNELPYEWNGITFTEAGTQSATLTTLNGCDSIVELNLTVLPDYDTMLVVAICEGETYQENGFNISSSGVYEQNLTAENGCDSTATLYLTINNGEVFEITETACDSYTWNDTTYTESGDYIQTFQNTFGCDSVVTLHLTVNESEVYEITETACDTYTWNETNYTESGDYIQTLHNTFGCDSVVTLHLTINESEVYEIIETACDTYTWNDKTYTESGDYIQPFQNTFGCDSVVTLHLTVNESETYEIIETACDSYTWNDTNYTESGDYIQTFHNTFGCDSVVTLHLTINESEVYEIIETACDTYTWNDKTYTESDDYSQTFQNTFGCDSVVTLHLTINESETYEFTETACDSYTWNDTTYTESGDYIQTFQNTFGCDSVVTLHLTVNESETYEFAETACDSYTWNETNYTESGDYSQTFQNTFGCDSVVTLHLMINESEVYEITETACDTYTWNETNYTESGDYIQTFQNTFGCDSVVTLHLTINEGEVYEIIKTACDFYTWNETTYTESGDYSQTFQNTFGCDSVVTLHLTVNESETYEFAETACDSYTWNDTTYTESGDYSQSFQNTFGCDSVVNMTLTVEQISMQIIAVDTICEHETYEWQSEILSGCEVGTNLWQDTLLSQHGCDSIIALNLTVLPSPINQTIVGSGKYCEGENGKEIRIEGSEVGKIYQLYQGGELLFEWEGNGEPHSFGIFENGVFHIWVIVSNGCSKQMGDAIIIGPTPQPPERQIRW